MNININLSKSDTKKVSSSGELNIDELSLDNTNSIKLESGTLLSVPGLFLGMGGIYKNYNVICKVVDKCIFKCKANDLIAIEYTHPGHNDTVSDHLNYKELKYVRFSII
jgi:hypothetical protein